MRGGNRQPLRDYLVLLHSPLVEHCARPFLSSGEPLEDLLQEGSIGLIKAVDRFDPEKGVRFSTYACHLIAGEMRHYLRDLGKMIHEPGWHAELRGQILRASDDLMHKLERPPQPEEIASALDMQPQIVRRVLDSGNVLAVASLDAESDDENGVPKTFSYDETDTSLESLSTHVENRLTLNEALPQLRELEQRAVTLFYYGEHSKTEVARQMGISVNYAAYLVKRGVEHLRRIIESEAPVVAATLAPLLPMNWRDLSPWIAANSQRAGAQGDGAPIEFALLLCRVANWKKATDTLNATARAQAEQAAANVMRRSCRKADKVLVVNNAPFEGLSFLALMPNTSINGARAGERWRRACNATSLRAMTNDALTISELVIEYSFVFSEGTAPVENDDNSALQQSLQSVMDDVLSRRPKTIVTAETARESSDDTLCSGSTPANDGLSLAADGNDNVSQFL